MKTQTKKRISINLKLLTVDNAKTRHGEELGILTGILYLNPAVTNKLCPFASDLCRSICLVNAGRAEFLPSIIVARTRKTDWFLRDKTTFIATLKDDIRKLERKAKQLGLRPAVRLNGTSDILWERLIDMTEFPNVQFYDYTKIPLHHRRIPANYHLTFSYSGTNAAHMEQALASGKNVAIVFTKTMPETYLGHRVIDGTVHDVRFLDGDQSLIVGLLPKGRKAKAAAKNGSAFFINGE